MKLRKFRQQYFIVIVLIAICVFPANIFAAESNRNLTLDDSSGDSPQVILRDQDDNDLTLQKLDSGEAEIVNSEGPLNLKPSADTDDYIQILTTGDSSYLYWMGVSGTNHPGIRVNPSTEKLEYRDEDSNSWLALDDLASGSITLDGLADTNFTTPAAGDILYYNGSQWINLTMGTSGQVLAVNAGATAPEWINAASGSLSGLTDTTLTGIGQGDLLYYNGTAWINLGPGTAGQVLQTGGAGADPSWVTVDGIVADGTAANNTLRWDGSDWMESTALTNDGTDVTAGGNITVGGDVAVNGGDLTTTSASANVVNTNATTVNIAGASTATAIGAGTGTTTINNDLNVANNATVGGNATVSGTLTTGSNGQDGALAIYSEQGLTDYTYTISPNAAATQDVTLMLPTDDGNAGQVLTTDGSGALSWSTISGSIVNGTSANNTLRWDGSSWVESTALANDGTDVTAGGNVTVTGDLTVSGDDITMATNTAGAVLVADGTNFNPVVAAGDATIDSTGAVTIANDAVETAMILDGNVTEDKLTASLAFDDGDLVDLSGVNASSTAEGIILPQAADVSAATAEGQITWDTDNDTLYVGDGTAAQAIAGGASQLSELSDVGTSTATSGNILVADGTDFDSVAVSGDIAIDNAGATTVQADAVALATDTTGNFVATVADAGNSVITVANSGTENAAVTLDITDGGVVENDLAASLVFDDGDLLNLSAVNASGTSEGIILPQATDVSAATAEGQITWDTDNDTLYVGDGTAAQEIAGGANQLSELSDVGTSTATSGNILVADGTDFDSVAVSGDIAIDNTGATTVQADAVALATDTTGNFVATVADAGNSVITVANSGTENAAVTLDITDGGVVENDLAASLAFDDGDLVDLSGVNASSTSEGIILPQATDVSAATAEGQITWDTDNDTLYVGDGTAAQAIAGGANQLSELSDVGTSTATSGNILVADGTDFDSVAVSGDATVASTGALTIANDAVALATDTTGNFVATVADAGNSAITVANSGTENAAVTLDITDGGVVENDLAASLAFDDGDLLNLSAVNASGTSEGIILPQAADVSAATAEGQISWDTDNDTLYVGDGTAAQAIAGGASQLSELSDVGTSTATSGNILIADGTDFDSVAVSGDIAIDNAGATTVQADAVALATDTTGNFVATVADAGNSAITVANSGTENAAVTLDITDGGVVENDLAASLAFDDGDLINLSAVNASGTTEGIILPQAADVSAATAEGQITWDTDNDTLYVGDGTAAQAIAGGANQLSELSDVGTSTATSGNILIADGTDFDSVAVSGDIAIDNAGATTVQADAVALATDTTGNFVATVADAGNSVITVANSGTESAAVTLDITDGGVVEDDLAASLAFDDGDLLNLSAVNASGTTEGIILPQAADVSAATAEGQITWDTDNDTLYVGDGTAAQAIAGGANQLSELSDVGTSTATSGNILIADGTDFDSVAVSGDIAIDNAGATTVQADAVALATDTTGNFVATVADAGNSVITVANSGTENAAVTLDITDGGVVENDLAASLAFDDGDLLNLSAVNASGTAEGIILPQAADVSAATAEGQISWDTDNDTLYVGDGTAAQAIAGGANQLSELSDVGTSTATSGNILIADGTDFDSVAVSGDIAIDNAGATTVQADAVALATDTTGNFVATVADAGNSVITVANSGTENAAVTLDITDGGVVEDDLAASLAFDDGDLLNLSAINASGTAEGIILPQAADVSAATAEGQISWDTDDDTLYVGDGSSAKAIPTDNIYSGDGTLDAARTIATGGNSLTIDGAGDIVLADSGDITTAGDVAVNGGDITSTATALNLDVADTGTIALRDGTNTLLSVADAGTTGNVTATGTLTASGGSITTGSDGADGSLVVYSEQGVTDYSYTINPNAAATQNVTLTLPADDGTSGQVLSTDGSGALSWADANGVTDGTAANNTLRWDGSDWVESTALTNDGTDVSASGNITATGDVAVNGGDITSTATALNVDVGDTGTIALRDGTNTLLSVADGGTVGNVAATGTLTASGGSITTGSDGTDGSLVVYSEQGVTDYTYTINPNAAATQNVTLTLPADDGDANQVLATDGSGALNWADANGVTDGTAANNTLRWNGTSWEESTALTNDDTNVAASGNITATGDVAVNGGDITSTATALNLDVADTGTIALRDGTNTLLSVADGGTTGNVTATGTLTASGGSVTTGSDGTDGSLVIYSDQGATDYSYTINPNAAATQNVTLTLPADDGDASQVLTTDGSGALSWADANGVTDGTAANNTLRWNGTAWLESTALTNDGTDITASGDVAVNGGDLTTTSTTANLVNTNATTVNIAGASTATSIGAATGTTTIGNDLTATGDTTVTGGDITVGAGTTAKQGAIVLHDNQAADSFTTTIQAADDVNASYTLTLPADDGTSGQVLSTDGSGALSWADANGVTDGTAANNTLRWNGTAWLESTALTNDGTDVSASGNITATGDVAVNGGDLTTTSTTANVVNTNATTVNIAGASTTTAIGSTASGTTTVGYDLTVSNDATISGNATVSGAGLTIGDGTTAAAGTIVLHDNQAGDSFTTTLASNDDVDADFTLTLPADDGTANQILETDGSGNLSWTDANGVTDGTAANNTLRWNGTAWLESTALTNDGTDVSASGNITATGDVAVNGGDITTSATTANVVNANATTVNIAGASTATSIGAATGTTTIGNDLTATGDTTVTGGDITVGAGTTAKQGTIVFHDNQAADSFTTTIQAADDVNASYTLTLPADDGTANQVLTTDGSGALSWADANGVTDGTAANNTLRWNGSDWVESAALTNDGTDVTATGDMAVNGGDITSTATALNMDVANTGTIALRDGTNNLLTVVDNGTTGNVTATGTLTTGSADQDGSLSIYSEQGATDYTYTINPHAAATQNVTLTLPADDGNANEVLTTDGSGALSWADANGVTDGTAANNTLRWNGTSWEESTALTNDGTDVTASGNITATGDVAVNGGDITTSATTANVVNANATTVNIAGASTATSIGAATGTTTIGNDLTATGDTTVTGGDITVGAGTTAKQGAIVFHDNQAADSFTTTIQAADDVNASYTLTLPADDGTSGQVLNTDGSGALSWADANGVTDGTATNNTLRWDGSDWMESTALTNDGTDVAASGNITATGDVAVNGGDITSTATALNVDVGDTGTIALRDGTNTLLSVADGGTVGNVTATGTLTASGGSITTGSDGTDGSLVVYSEQGVTDYSYTINPNAAATQNVTLTLPADDGDANQVLATDGSGALSWADANGVADGTAASNTLRWNGTAWVESTALTNDGTDVAASGNITATGDVAVNGGDITSTATALNVDVGDTGTIALRDGTNTLLSVADGGTVGNVTATGTLTASGGSITTGSDGTDGSLVVYSEQGATDYTYTINPNAAATQNVTLTLPADDGTANQVLATDGAGNLSWTTDLYGTVQGTDNTYDIRAADEGTTAGDTRGENSVDLQTTRNASTQVASGLISTVSGGDSNTASGAGSTVSGGGLNTASNQSATVSGGFRNTASGSESTVSAGRDNTASGMRSIVSGGAFNTASGDYSFAAGRSNTASGMYSAVSNGWSNTASGEYSAVSNGLSNIAAGDYSWAGGRNMQIDAAADRTFAWGSDTSAVSITQADAFIIYSSDVGIGTITPGSKLDVQGTLRLSGSTSGYVGFAPAAAAGSTTYTLPTADGTSGQVLSTDGSGALSWASAVSANGTAANNTLRWDGSNWVESSALTNDGTDVVASSNITATGDMAVNGGDITTTSITANLVNTNATTVNIAGASTATSIGAATGTTTIGNDLTATGDTTVTGGDITVGAGTTAKQGAIVFHDNQAADSFTTTIQAADDVNASYTLTLPADDGTANQVLSTDGSGALSWADANGVADGTAASNTLRWNGTAWVESTALTNDDTNVAASGNITATGDVAVNGGDITSTATALNLDVADTGTIALRDGTNTLLSVADAGTTGNVTATGTLTASGGSVTTGSDGTDGSLVIYSDQGATDYSYTINPHATATQNVTLTLPADDGTADQVLTTDGSGALSWADANGVTDGTAANNTLRWNGTAWLESTALTNDGTDVAASGNITATGDVAVNGGDITSTATALNMDVGDTGTIALRDGTNNLLTVVDNGTTGNVTATGTLTASGGSVTSGSDGTDGSLVVYSEQGATDYTYTINPNAAATQNVTLTLPADDGDASQVLATDGAGNLSWTTDLYGTVQGTDNTYDIRAADQGTTAGDTRGENSVDLQTARTASTHVASGLYSTISGGVGNTASGNSSTVFGGNLNTASGVSSVVAGNSNTASGTGSTVSGGANNTASGNYSIVSGGYNNTAAGDFSWAGGRSMQIDAAADRTFAWGYDDSAVSITQADAFIIYSSDVGIGKVDPGSELDVQGTLRLSGSTSGYVGFAPAAAAGSTTYTLPTADGTSGQVLSTDGSGALSWADANGVTDGTAANNTLRWDGSNWVESTLLTNDGTAGTGYITVANNLRVGSPSIGHITVDGSDAVIADDVEIDGDLWVDGTFSAPSDIRLKTNIATLSNVLTKIGRLRGIHYEFKDQDAYASGPQIGLVAQELQEVFPELVTEGADGYLAINYTRVSAILVQAINEQQVQIETIKQDNTRLKDKVEGLERKSGELHNLVKQMNARLTILEQK